MTSFAIKPVKLRDIQALLDRAVDLCFLAILFLAPLLMGGRHPVGRLGFVGLILLALVLWSVRQVTDPNARVRRSGVEWLVLLVLAIPIVQLIHLPQAWLVTLAPNLPQLLPEWFSGDSQSALGAWSQLSLYPDATRNALVMCLAYAALFLLVVQRIKSVEDIERFLRWIALAAVSLAILGIAQMLLSNGKFLWVYEHPSRDTLRTVKGPFANENHYAHFLALGIGPLVWWLWHLKNSRNGVNKGHRKRRSRFSMQEGAASRSLAGRSMPSRSFSSSMNRAGTRQLDHVQMLLWLALPIIAIAGLLTFSRGGVIALAISATFAVSTYMMAKLFGRRSIMALAGLVAVVVAALSIYGFDRLSGELESVTTGSIDQLDTNSARRKLWAADIEAFRDFAVLGTGVATHREVYPTYYEDNSSVEYTHAESGYFQVLMECGVVGGCALLMAIGVCLLWGWRCLKFSSDKGLRAIALAILAGLLVSALHSIWDFVWYIPACITLTLIQAACLCRLSQICQGSKTSDSASSTANARKPAHNDTKRSSNGTATERPSRIRLSWLLTSMLLAVGSCQMVKCLIPAARAAPAWDRYASLVIATKSAPTSEGSPPILAAIPDLESACKLNPNDARANLKLTALYQLRFERNQASAANPMTLDEIRQAAVASEFSSIEQQDQWLSVAVGPNRGLLLKAHHFAHRAARLSPLQGEAYVHLSRLEFLHGGDLDASNALMMQAVQVRPHDGGVLISAAVDSAQFGNLKNAMDYFRRAFRQGSDHQRQVIDMLADSLPAAEFLKEFVPDLTGLRHLFHYYRRAERREDAEVVARLFLPQLESTADSESRETAARLWYEAHAVYEYMNGKSQTLMSLRRAVELMPDDFSLRKAYAVKLAGYGSTEAAIAELRWCLRRKPDDPSLKQIMKRVTQEQMRESDVAKATNEGKISRR